MKNLKSKKLKKLETELQDLEQWLKLGLVPKKDVERHKEEIISLQQKIEEEKERLLQLKESGESEEYAVPKSPAARGGGYNEMPTLPDVDPSETMGGNTETGFEMATDAIDIEHTMEEREEDEDEATEREEEEEEDESYFSDRNRWRRGGIVDPDANDW